LLQAYAASSSESDADAAASSSHSSSGSTNGSSNGKMTLEEEFNIYADKHQGQFALRKLYHESDRLLAVLYTGACPVLALVLALACRAAWRRAAALASRAEPLALSFCAPPLTCLMCLPACRSACLPACLPACLQRLPAGPAAP
jgi:hypothetical protein